MSFFTTVVLRVCLKFLVWFQWHLALFFKTAVSPSVFSDEVQVLWAGLFELCTAHHLLGGSEGTAGHLVIPAPNETGSKCPLSKHTESSLFRFKDLKVYKCCTSTDASPDPSPHRGGSDPLLSSYDWTLSPDTWLLLCYLNLLKTYWEQFDFSCFFGTILSFRLSGLLHVYMLV